MIFFLLFFLFITSFCPSFGVNEFTTNQNINYEFNDIGSAKVTHTVKINNNYSQFYPKEYSLSLSGSHATDINSFDSSGTIPTTITQLGDEIKLQLTLSNSKTGKDQVTLININYKSDSLAKKKGKTWEVALPQFQDSLSNTINISLKIPSSFGKLSSSPPGAIISTDSQFTSISFNQYNQKNKLVLSFGEYQLFNFELSYQIQNSTPEIGIFTIPLPPDTANQKIYFDSIVPNPIKIENDPDGNWLAFFEIKPQVKLDIVATGQAKIGQNPNYKFVSSPIFNSQLYWPVDNSEFVKLGKTYKTPKQIYDFVVSALDYDHNRINNSARLGAISALSKPNNSLCTDFTDLFVTIARAANIGAREIEGYAYSNNTTIKPLSQGTDILHAWPEYYDPKKQKWIPIDPTWAKTTGGINYFDDLDLNHFAFVIHNTKSDSPPPPGSYKSDSNQKSVNISFAQTENDYTPKHPIITTKFNPFSQSYLIIHNPNLFAIDNFSLASTSPQTILPLSKIQINFPKSAFINSLKTKSQKINISYSYNNLPPETANIQNPFHFFNLFIVIISSLILLSISAIILIRHK